MRCQLIIEIKTEVGRRMRRIKWRHSPTNPQRYYQYFFMSVCLDSRWCDGRWYGKKYLLWCLWVYINLLRWFSFQRRVMAWFIRRGNKKENVVRDKKENLFRELWREIMIGEVCGVGCAMKARRSLRFMMIDFVILARFNYFLSFCAGGTFDSLLIADDNWHGKHSEIRSYKFIQWHESFRRHYKSLTRHGESFQFFRLKVTRLTLFVCEVALNWKLTKLIRESIMFLLSHQFYANLKNFSFNLYNRT